jgi:hypothetical protein
MALPLSPEPLAALYSDLWRDAKAVKNWKAGQFASEILKRGPPEGLGAVEYRLRSRRSAEAWVPLGAEPRAAIAMALGVSAEDIIVLGAALEAESAVKKHLGRKPTIAETENSLWPREAHLRLPFSAERAPRCPPPKRLSFAAMLRPDEGEGVLLTELACQSDWGSTLMLPSRRFTSPSGGPMSYPHSR